MPDVFLSYSREDQITARRFADGLKAEGFSVWWDQALSAGQAFDRVTEKALDEAKAVVVLWSRHSVDSNWVRAEATQAQASQRLVPVMIEPCKRPIMFELTHTADLSGWTGDQADSRWRSLIEGLRQFAQTATPTVLAPTALPPQPATRLRAIWATAAIVLLALGAGGIWYWQGRGTSAPRVSSNVEASVAVLPFRDMSQNKDQEYFADGVTEEILNSLAGLKDLKVTARTSAFAFKGKDVDLRSVGETLGVQHILEGSIRKDGETLRITAQLIDTKSDAHLWSKTYDRHVKDVFSVQEDIARSVAEALQVSLGVGFGAQRGMTRDVDAYDAFLKAGALWPVFTAESRRRGTDLLQQAVDRDPKFAFAWSNLAVFCASMPALEGGGPAAGDPKVWLSRSEAAFGEFEKLMGGTPALYQALAGRSIRAGRFSEAAKYYKETAAAAAKSGTAWDEWEIAPLLAQVGRLREAIVVLERALARDPLNPGAVFYLGHVYSAVGNVQASYAAFERSDEFGPTGREIFLGGALITAMGARDKVQVRRRLDRLIEATPDPTGVQFNAAMKAGLDKPSQAFAALRELVHDPSTPSLNLGIAAIFTAYFGNAEGALEILRSPRLGAPAGLGTLDIWGPVFRDMRKLPAFKDFVRDIGLVDYWREYGWGDFCKPTTGDDFECT